MATAQSVNKVHHVGLSRASQIAEAFLHRVTVKGNTLGAHLLHGHARPTRLLLVWHERLATGVHRSRFVHLAEELAEVIDCKLQVERHVGSIESSFVEGLAGLDDPQTVDSDNRFTSGKKMIQQVILQYELDTLVVGLT